MFFKIDMKSIQENIEEYKLIEESVYTGLSLSRGVFHIYRTSDIFIEEYVYIGVSLIEDF